MTTERETKENVIPETEMARRRRVNELLEDISDLTNDLHERAKELDGIVDNVHEFGILMLQAIGPGRIDAITKWVTERVPGAGDKISGYAAEAAAEFAAAFVAKNPELRDAMRDAIGPAIDEEAEEDDLEDDEPVDDILEGVRRKKAVILRLFDEAPKLENPDGTPDTTQAPAVECFVLLRGAPGPIHGSLSVTQEGLLRMLTPASKEGTKNGRKVDIPVLCEQFFDVADVVSIMLERAVAADTGSIITSA